MQKEQNITLISHKLCPYVQRAVVAMTEKDMPFERVDVDLSNKPDWFKAISPLGKTPVLKVGDTAIFESAVICEYLEETGPNPLHPTDPLKRADHRAWIEFGSAILGDIWGFYTAKDEDSLMEKRDKLRERFQRIEDRLVAAPWFDGAAFSLVDAVFGPVFRYFDTFDQIADFGVFDGLSKVQSWRKALSERPSIQNAVSEDYPELLMDFLIRRDSYLSALIKKKQAA